MINQDLKNTKVIFDKMKKLYPSFEMPDEIDVQVWTEILEGYSQTDILEALKNYRKNVPYNVAPLPAKFKEYLPEKNRHVETETTAQAAKGDFAWEQMNADIEAGSCRNNLYVYRDAERIVLEDWLMRELPIEVWRKMSYASRVKVATEKGLFGDFDEALRMAAQKRFNRDYEYLSANDLENLRQQKSKSSSGNSAVKSVQNTVNYLASHWSA